MASTYVCRHDGETHHFLGEKSWLYCGCDGTTHLACEPRPAPAGTPRPDDWPIFLAWDWQPFGVTVVEYGRWLS